MRVDFYAIWTHTIVGHKKWWGEPSKTRSIVRCFVMEEYLIAKYFCHWFIVIATPIKNLDLRHRNGYAVWLWTSGNSYGSEWCWWSYGVVATSSLWYFVYSATSIFAFSFWDFTVFHTYRLWIEISNDSKVDPHKKIVMLYLIFYVRNHSGMMDDWSIAETFATFNTNKHFRSWI